MRALLRDRSFELDCDDPRKHVSFANGVFNRDSGIFEPRSPHARAMHSTGWNLYPMIARRDIATALQMADDDGLNFTSATIQTLEGCSLPVLNYLYDICGEWDRTLYCLKHVARSIFALKFQECLWTRGAGSNGKDTLAILMKSLLDDYFHSATTGLLTNVRGLDSPSQSVYNLRGKRFCVIREITKT